jgi:hypothetical protein
MNAKPRLVKQPPQRQYPEPERNARGHLQGHLRAFALECRPAASSKTIRLTTGANQ